MRNHIITILFVSLSVMSCQSARVLSPVAHVPEEEETIQVVEESFDFELEADRLNHDTNRFFVILGSFRINENADRFKATLEEQGFSPVILLSETGLHRVCTDSYTVESEARQRVLHIRRTYPEYYDAWLLIRR